MAIKPKKLRYVNHHNDLRDNISPKSHISVILNRWQLTFPFEQIDAPDSFNMILRACIIKLLLILEFYILY